MYGGHKGYWKLKENKKKMNKKKAGKKEHNFKLSEPELGFLETQNTS